MNNIKQGILKINWKKKAENIHNSQRFSRESTFHNKTRTIFMVASFFGLFPVKNIYQKNIMLLETNTISINCLYSWFLCVSYALAASYSLDNLNLVTDDVGGLTKSTTHFFFYGTCAIGSYLFINVAKSWPEVLQKWSKLQEEFKFLEEETGYVFSTPLLAAIGIVHYCSYIWINSKCDDLKEGHYTRHLEAFIINSHYYLVYKSTYKTWKGIAIFLMTTAAGFVWKFTDIFIIMLANTLVAHMTSFNAFQKNVMAIQNSNERWIQFRGEYLKLIEFIKMIDEKLNKLLALSVLNNIYFLSTSIPAATVQLINVYKNEGSISWAIYYVFLCVYLFIKIYCLLMTTASVNLKWREAAFPLYACSSQLYCQEAERRLQEIYTDSVGLSVLNLFLITRSFILAIFGFMLSYEMFLLYNTMAYNRNSTLPENNTALI